MLAILLILTSTLALSPLVEDADAISSFSFKYSELPQTQTKPITKDVDTVAYNSLLRPELKSVALSKPVVTDSDAVLSFNLMEEYLPTSNPKPIVSSSDAVLSFNLAHPLESPTEPTPEPTPTPTPTPTPEEQPTITITSPSEINLSQSITISGNLYPPQSLILTLTLYSPSGETIEQPVLSTLSGSYSFEFQPNEVGEWIAKIECVINGNLIQNQTSFTVKEKQVEVGYAIIVVGRNDEWLSQQYIDLTAEFVYQCLKKRGFSDDRILYLNPRLIEKVDMLTSKQNLTYAFELVKQNLSVNKPLLLYLIDHARNNEFLLNGFEEVLTADELDSLLDSLTGYEITVIIEACNSGSFIDELSEQGRIIVTSTSASSNALLEKTGATFSRYFFNAIAKGKSIAEAFEEASNAPEIKAYSEMLSKMGLNPQTPLLDDNADGEGHAADELEKEGGFASSTYIGSQFSLDFPPVITAVVEDKTVELGEEVELWAEVAGDVKEVYATIVEPSINLTLSNESMHELNLTEIELSKQDGLYKAKFKPAEEGNYTVIIHAVDEGGNLALPKEVVIEVKSALNKQQIKQQIISLILEYIQAPAEQKQQIRQQIIELILKYIT